MHTQKDKEKKSQYQSQVINNVNMFEPNLPPLEGSQTSKKSVGNPSDAAS